MTMLFIRLSLYVAGAIAAYSILDTQTANSYWQLAACVLFFAILALAPDQPRSKLIARIVGGMLCALMMLGVAANVMDYRLIQSQNIWQVEKLPSPSWEALLANSDAKSYTATLTDALCIGGLIEGATIKLQRRSNKLATNTITIARLKVVLAKQVPKPQVAATDQSKQCGDITVSYSDPPSQFYAFSEELMTLYPISENNND